MIQHEAAMPRSGHLVGKLIWEADQDVLRTRSLYPLDLLQAGAVTNLHLISDPSEEFLPGNHVLVRLDSF